MVGIKPELVTDVGKNTLPEIVKFPKSLIANLLYDKFATLSPIVVPSTLNILAQFNVMVSAT